MNIRKHTLLLATLLIAIHPLVKAQKPTANLPHIGVDQRIELMAIIFRLASNREYNQGKLQPYVSEIGRDRFPQIETFDFDEQGTAFRMRVKLEPAHEYELFLNRVSGGAFAGRDGVLLAPFQIQFRTR